MAGPSSNLSTHFPGTHLKVRTRAHAIKEAALPGTSPTLRKRTQNGDLIVGNIMQRFHHRQDHNNVTFPGNKSQVLRILWTSYSSQWKDVSFEGRISDLDKRRGSPLRLKSHCLARNYCEQKEQHSFVTELEKFCVRKPQSEQSRYQFHHVIAISQIDFMWS